MDQLITLFNNFIDISAEAAPWLLLGLLIAGLMKVWVPSKILSRHLGHGKKAIIKAAFIGAPLPLCSCGVIPVATELKRSGASDPATAAFLVATPETGVDSVAVSYALLGPILAIYRPITAIISAIITGLLVLLAKPKSTNLTAKSTSKNACCSSKNITVEQQTTSCCATQQASNVEEISVVSKTLSGIKYAATQLLDDIIKWLVLGLVFATLIRTYLPPEFLASYGSGLIAMLLMILISIPMYICATASTPVAAGLILAGISPGTALVFMMAGPATNISTLGVIKNEMGASVLMYYLLGISLCAIGFGFLLDWGLSYYAIDFNQQVLNNHNLLPYWFNLACVVLIAFLSCKPLRKLIFKA